MYNQCEACKKFIDDANDCRLTSNDGVTIHTYCKNCHEQMFTEKEKPKTTILS